MLIYIYMHSVYMTLNPCVYNPSLHVCTQCTEPSQYGWGPSERWGLQQKSRVYLHSPLEQARPCQHLHQCCGLCREARIVWSWQVNQEGAATGTSLRQGSGHVWRTRPFGS